MSYESLHWSILNIFARLFGLMAGLSSIAFAMTALMKFTGASLPTSQSSPLVDLFVAAFGLLVSVGFLTARPYRPDISKRYTGSLGKSHPKLGWWTGRPKRQ